MLAQALFNAGVALGIVWFLGAAVAVPLRLRPSTSLERDAYHPLLGAAALAVMVSVGLLLHAPNILIAIVLWGLTILGGLRAWTDSELASDASERWVRRVFACYVIAQICFIAHPNAEGLDPERQMSRGSGLPIDGALPFFVARFVIDRFDPARELLYGDWYLGDRTPLMGLAFAGVRMMLGLTRYSDYVGVGSVFNALVLLPAWLLLRRLSGAMRAPAILAVLAFGSAFLTLNTWFTWPRLMATAFLLLAFDALHAFPGERRVLRAGLFAALAWLTHPVAVFYLPALALLALRGDDLRSRLRGAFRFTAAVIVTCLPWLIVTRTWLGDSNRLLKWHLFGQTAPTTLSLREVGVRYWQSHSLGDLLAIRAANASFPWRTAHFFEGVRAWSAGRFSDTARSWAQLSFHTVIGALNPLLVAGTLLAIAWMLARGGFPALKGGRSASAGGLLFLAAGGFLSAVAIFGSPDETSNQHWAHGTVLALLILIVWIQSAAPRWLMRVSIAATLFVEGVVIYGHLLGEWLITWPLGLNIAAVALGIGLAMRAALTPAQALETPDRPPPPTSSASPAPLRPDPSAP